MNKIDNLIPLVYGISILFMIIYVKKLVDDGRDALDLLGDDPFGYAGTSEWDMGFGAWIEYLNSGGTTEGYEDIGGSVPWYVYNPDMSWLSE